MTKILIKRHANIVRDKHRVPTQFPLYRHTWIRVKLALCIKKGGKSINTIRDIGIGWISLIEQTRGGQVLQAAVHFTDYTHAVCGVARWAWFDYSSFTKPVICLYTSDHKCNGKRVENASTFHAIVWWGGDTRSREISSRVEWSFLPCWRGEGGKRNSEI